MDANDIRAAVDAKLAELGIVMYAHHVGEHEEKPTEKDGKPWKHDLWYVTFKGAEGHPRGDRLTTEFRTGLGHRKYPAGYPHFDKTLRHGTLAWEAQEKRKTPVKPHAATVLHSLCMDAEAASMSFSDWCDTVGYDSDSITALNTYQACDKIGREMRAFFGASVCAELAALVQDY